MVIGDENVHAAGPGIRHARVARYAVVDGHDQRRRPGCRQRDDLRSQSITELEAVRHEEIDRSETPGTHRTQHERGAGRPVCVEIPDDEHAAGEAMAQQQIDRRCGTLEGPDREQAIERQVKLQLAADAAGRVDALQDRVNVGAKPHGVRSGTLAPYDSQSHRRASRPGRGRRQNLRPSRAVNRSRRSFATRDTRSTSRRSSACTAGATKRLSSSASASTSAQ